MTIEEKEQLDDEITALYRGCKNHKKQVKIISDLTGKDIGYIQKVLIEKGMITKSEKIDIVIDALDPNASIQLPRPKAYYVNVMPYYNSLAKEKIKIIGKRKLDLLMKFYTDPTLLLSMQKLRDILPANVSFPVTEKLDIYLADEIYSKLAYSRVSNFDTVRQRCYAAIRLVKAEMSDRFEDYEEKEKNEVTILWIKYIKGITKMLIKEKSFELSPFEAEKLMKIFTEC